jgi:hypothetical protein
MPAAYYTGLCGKFSMGLYGEISKNPAVTSKTVLLPREKAFSVTDRRSAAFCFGTVNRIVNFKLSGFPHNFSRKIIACTSKCAVSMRLDVSYNR